MLIVTVFLKVVNYVIQNLSLTATHLSDTCGFAKTIPSTITTYQPD